MKTDQNYTLITGASTGLGKALAINFARLGKNLILTALPGENLKRTCSEIHAKYHVEVNPYESDLTVSKKVKKFAQWVNSNFNIEVLINNAGIGGTFAFCEAPLHYIDHIILLNVRAMVVLTHMLMPNLLRQSKAYILNVASIASFGPFPYKTVYPASKAFVYSFSRGLSNELKNTSISVSVAHPGAMATNIDVCQRINSHSGILKSSVLCPDEVARICIKCLFKNQRCIIPGFMNKLTWLALKLFPFNLTMSFMGSVYKREYYQKAGSNSPSVEFAGK